MPERRSQARRVAICRPCRLQFSALHELPCPPAVLPFVLPMPRLSPPGELCRSRRARTRRHAPSTAYAGIVALVRSAWAIVPGQAHGYIFSMASSCECGTSLLTEGMLINLDTT